MLRFTASGDALMVRPFPESYSDRDTIGAYINKGDLRLTNLETTITDLNRYGSAYSGGTWVAAEENVLAELSELGFNCFGISNNHTMDYSYEGLHQTLDALDRAGLAHAGAGSNRDEAEAPALVKTPNGTFAVISVCSTFNMAAAAGAATPYLPGRPGLNYLRFVPVFQVHAHQLQALKELGSSVNINGLKELHRAQGFETALPEGIYEFGGNWFRAVPDDQPIGRTSHCNTKDLQRICESVRRAKEMADAVIVQIHSHEVKTDCDEEADFFMEECARACIDAGASAIVGGGTHQLKGIEVYKGCPIFYSLGNFVFQNSLVAKLPADFLEKYGLPLTATAPEAIRARSATATADLAASTPCFRSVIPLVELQNGKAGSITLQVIELGQARKDEQRNLPHPADAEVTRQVFESLQRISACYGTRFQLQEDGTIRVLLGEEVAV